MKTLALSSLWLAASVATAQGWAFDPVERTSSPFRPQDDFQRAIENAVSMVERTEPQQLVDRFGLDLVNLTWEDTGRYKGSSVGPNISDLTIQVFNRRGGEATAHCMPVIRFPNFSDVTGDIDPRNLTLMVGNEDRRSLQRVSLAEYLDSPQAFMSRPREWRGPEDSLLAPRDQKVLVSAQACFLPIPRSGKASFNPVLFNYQSRPGDPAVLAILATREGTSMTVIDNKRDAFASGGAWGQRLFFNSGGQRASLTGERVSDVIRKGGGSVEQAKREGWNMVMLIQVPLRQRSPMRDSPMPMASGGGFGGGAAQESAQKRSGNRSDTEDAVISYGQLEGRFTETDNLVIQRDERFPVRVTVQFYKATTTGNISENDAREIKNSIESVYKQAENVGSLVTQGRTGRITEYWGSKVQPRDWWEQFWRRYCEDSGTARPMAEQRLRARLGDFEEKPVTDLYLREILNRP
jgi:hypothetical protein